MNIDEIYILEDRGFVFINGEDAKDFLQNIITNNINAVTDNNSSFASILTPQGKYLIDFFILNTTTVICLIAKNQMLNN